MKYQNLLEKNAKLENELTELQQKSMFNEDIISDTEITEPSEFLNSDFHGSTSNNLGCQSSSRLVKFEESLC